MIVHHWKNSQSRKLTTLNARYKILSFIYIVVHYQFKNKYIYINKLCKIIWYSGPGLIRPPLLPEKSSLIRQVVLYHRFINMGERGLETKRCGLIRQVVFPRSGLIRQGPLYVKLSIPWIPTPTPTLKVFFSHVRLLCCFYSIKL